MQRLTLQVLHRDEVLVTDLRDFVRLDDVRVVQPAGQARMVENSTRSKWARTRSTTRHGQPSARGTAVASRVADHRRVGDTRPKDGSRADQILAARFATPHRVDVGNALFFAPRYPSTTREVLRVRLEPRLLHSRDELLRSPFATRGSATAFAMRLHALEHVAETAHGAARCCERRRSS
jgi:hypothetical protein